MVRLLVIVSLIERVNKMKVRHKGTKRSQKEEALVRKILRGFKETGIGGRLCPATLSTGEEGIVQYIDRGQIRVFLSEEDLKKDILYYLGTLLDRFYGRNSDCLGRNARV
jgi:hypothetical protein